LRKISVAILDSDVRMLNYMRKILAGGAWDVVTYDSGERALECVRAGDRPGMILISSDLRDMDCLEVIRQIRVENPNIRIVVMALPTQLGELVAAIRAGACNLLQKPFLPQDLLNVVENLKGESQPRRELKEVELRVSDRISLVYSSPAIGEIHRQAELVARVSLPILILGDSGTGKEVIARYIHSRSQQAKNAFLKVNCAAVPSELLESELFGYERGAFTGAVGSKPGKFKLCDQGTMFLDEIGEMHPGLQSKLLQVLQDGTFSPLGSRTTEKVTVRIIAATNIDMNTAIANRTFREDLYYRLNGFCLKLPPLSGRREDIPSLLRHFLGRYSRELGLEDVCPSPSSRLEKACMRYDWPGNVRELESFVKRYLVLGDEQLMVDELEREVIDREPQAEVTPTTIVQAIQSAGGNRRAAAKTLGISYKVLLRRLRQFHLESPPNPTWVT
jgi:two-component system, NtrC family, response regulator AtoC